MRRFLLKCHEFDTLKQIFCLQKRFCLYKKLVPVFCIRILSLLVCFSRFCLFVVVVKALSSAMCMSYHHFHCSKLSKDKNNTVVFILRSRCHYFGLLWGGKTLNSSFGDSSLARYEIRSFYNTTYCVLIILLIELQYHLFASIISHLIALTWAPNFKS